MSNQESTFWKIAGPVFAALVLGSIGFSSLFLDKRLVRIESDIQLLLNMHMQTVQVEQEYDFTETN